MRHKLSCLTLAEMHAQRQIPFLVGRRCCGCHVPADTGDGQTTASASLFQSETRQVRLNCLWFKLICSDLPLEQIISPSWEAATTSAAFDFAAERLALHLPRPHGHSSV